MLKHITVKGYKEDIDLDPRILRMQAFSPVMSEEDAFAQLDRFVSLGGRTFDTAAIYGNFEMNGAHQSEEIIGKWLKKQPNANEFKIITKGGHYGISTPTVSRITPECLAIDLEQSLQALGMDAIDIYLLHRDNPEIPVGEIMECLNGFLRQGKIRAIGTANWTAARIKEANDYAIAHSLQPFTCSEVSWGLAVSLEHNGDQIEMTKSEYLEYLDMDIVVFAEDADQNDIFAAWNADRSIELPDNYSSRATRMAFESAQNICSELGVSPKQMALAYVLNNTLRAGVVVSADDETDMKDLMASTEIVLSPEQVKWLDDPRTFEGNLYAGVSRTDIPRELTISATPEPIHVSKIILGTAQFGSGLSKEKAFAIMDAYYAAGGHTIDTANVYGKEPVSGKSLSEIYIGEWLKSRNLREKMQIITKGCHPDLAKMDVPRVGAAFIRQDLAESLANLQTDYIDIYQLHRDNPDVPVEEIMECLHECVMSGKIHAISASNWTTERIDAANAYARSRGITEFTSSEVNRSLAVMNPGSMGADVPDMTEEDLCYYQSHSLPILAWGSLGGGYVIKGAEGRLDTLKPVFLGQFQNAASDWRIKTMTKVMRDSGLKADELCVAYVTNHPVESAAIVGASKAEQIQKLMQAANLVIPQEMIDDLEYLPPHVISEMGAKKEHPLDEPFTMDTPLREMWSETYHSVLEEVYGEMWNHPMVKMIEGLSFHQLKDMPGAEAATEKAEELLSALNRRRLELLAENN